MTAEPAEVKLRGRPERLFLEAAADRLQQQAHDGVDAVIADDRPP